MKLLLDENIPVSIFRFLSQHKISASHALFLNLRGAGDDAIFNYAVARKMTLVTFDKDFLSDEFLNKPHYGIIFISHHGKDMAALSQSLVKTVGSYKTLKSKIVVI